jgi:hypothetical protein
MPHSLGDKLNDYEVFSLGQGAMGKVYKPLDTRHHTVCHEHLPQEQFNDCFEREVRGGATLNQSRRLLAFSCLLTLCSSGGMAQTASNPQRWQAQYTPIYYDNVETIVPTLGPGFILDAAGSLTSTSPEVIAGTGSVRGSYFGATSFTPYLHTDSTVIPLTPNHAYQVTFQYKVLTSPSNGFEVLFYSPTGGAAGSFLPSTQVTGAAGTTGTATLTNTLGPYSDYQARWDIIGTGAISIDTIQVIDTTTGKVIAGENAEGTAPSVSNGLRLLNGASITADPTVVLDGKASIRLKNFATVATNPVAVALSGNTTYVAEFSYRILNPGNPPVDGGNDSILFAWLQPDGNSNQQVQVSASKLLKNASATGIFSTGAYVGSASSWIFNIAANGDSEVVIDNIRILRQDAVTSGNQPAVWANLSRLPFPRLGRFILGSTLWPDRPGGVPFQDSIDQIEGRLAFADVIAGLPIDTQTQAQPDSIRRLRALNPNVVIMPYRIAEEEIQNVPPSQNGNFSLQYEFLREMSDDWYVRDAQGSFVAEFDFPQTRFMNLSPFSPVIGGETYFDHLLNTFHTKIFPSGLWDGVAFDNYNARTNPHIPTAFRTDQFDFDWNRNGVRDETPASTTDMTRSALIGMLQKFRATEGDLQLIIGNSEEPSLAPYTNGFLLECVNSHWGSTPNFSPARWRADFDTYRELQTTARAPRINLVEACGPQYANGTPSNFYVDSTVDDLRSHRLTMGTALLSDGFYGFDLHGNLSVPRWYDEYSVDGNGTAVEDRSKKGYLGQALTGAVELTDGGTLIFQENFDASTVPSSFSQFPLGAVSVSNGSLVISNPDHTKNATVSANTNPTFVRLSAAKRYLLTFDFRILETLDSPQHGFQVGVFDSNNQSLDTYSGSEVAAGDSGTAHFPFTITIDAPWSIRFAISGGGGKIAIDNVRIYEGGVGPWRRDFENGFTLVNPFNEPHTFSSAELAGTLNRTGIRRIKGTQAPDVNNGQPVAGDLTLGAFDAIILLADRLNLPGCSYSLNYSGQAFAAQGGTGTITITTGADCPWNVGALPAGVSLLSAGSGVGTGSITFQVSPNVGGGVSRSFTIADQTFTIEQSAAFIPGLAAAGSLGQVASEGTWDFSLIGINLGASAATARFNFTDNFGNPLMLPLTFPQLAPAAGPELASTIDRTLNPNAQIVMDSTGPDSAATLVGSGQLLSNGNMSGFGIFSNPRQHWNAVVPLETRNASKYILAFDNTSPLTTGVAVANLAAQSGSVPVIIRDETGTQIGTPTIQLSAMGHTSFMLDPPPPGFPLIKGKRGTIEFDTPPGGQISVLGLRANGPALTTLPVLANVGTTGGSITHVAYNGGWTSVFYIVNTGNASAQFTLNFFDENGLALPVPLLLPQSGTNTTTAALTQTLAPGAMLVVNTNEQDSPTPVVGSAQLTTTGNISGFEIFRWTTFGQEASVPLETRTPNSFVLVFDDTNGLTTGVALASNFGLQVNVTATFRDDTGSQIGVPQSITLPSHGHQSFLLPDLLQAAAGKRGTVEFLAPPGQGFSVIGLRARSDGTLTTIPVLTK